MKIVMEIHTQSVLLVAQSINVANNLHYIHNEIANFRGHGQPVDIKLILQAQLRICHQLTTLPHRILDVTEQKEMLSRLQVHQDGQSVTVQDLPKLLNCDVQCFLHNIQPGQVVEIKIPREGGWYPEYRLCVASDKSAFKLVAKFDGEIRKCWPVNV
jgi:DNA-directed RNA polymerase subunit H (RpoH/RPB5)